MERINKIISLIAVAFFLQACTQAEFHGPSSNESDKTTAQVPATQPETNQDQTPSTTPEDPILNQPEIVNNPSPEGTENTMPTGNNDDPYIVVDGPLIQQRPSVTPIKAPTRRPKPIKQINNNDNNKETTSTTVTTGPTKDELFVYKREDAVKIEYHEVTRPQTKILRTVYLEETKTRRIVGAPSLSNTRYSKAAYDIMKEVNAKKHFLARLAIRNAGNGQIYFHTDPINGIAVDSENIRYIAYSGVCELKTYGPCLLVQQNAPYLMAVGVNTMANGSQEFLFDYLDRANVASGNILLTADKDGTILYANKRKVVEKPVTSLPKSSTGKSAWGRCSFQADIDVTSEAFILLVEKGIGKGKFFCRYNNGKTQELPVKVTLKAFGAGLNLDFNGDGNPFKTVKHISIRGSGIGYTPNIKDMLCKYSSIGVDLSVLGLGVGANTGPVGRNSNSNDKIKVWGCKEGTAALALDFRTIDGEGFATSIGVRAQNIWTEVDNSEF